MNWKAPIVAREALAVRVDDMEERFCIKCGKIFIPAPYHIYKDKNGIYCSWTCYNHRDITSVKTTKSVEQYTQRGELLRVYNSASQAAEYVGASVRNIYEACRNGNIYLGYYWKYEKPEREKQDYE